MVRPRQAVTLSQSVKRRFAEYIAANSELNTSDALRHLPTNVIRWGKLRLVEDVAIVHAALVVTQTTGSGCRDATFVKVSTNLNRKVFTDLLW